jgi:hypothetical protein
VLFAVTPFDRMPGSRCIALMKRAFTRKRWLCVRKREASRMKQSYGSRHENGESSFHSLPSLLQIWLMFVVHLGLAFPCCLVQRDALLAREGGIGYSARTFKNGREETFGGEPCACFDRFSTNGKFHNQFSPRSVRPELVEGWMAG